jgi:osmoprotectant transport system permease protein
MYRALKNKKVDIICGFATDGRIKAYNLRILDDDKSYFPRYDAAPLMRGDTFRKYPELRGSLDLLSGRLTDTLIRDLNYRVDQLKRSPHEVSREFIHTLNLPSTSRAPADRSIVIGSKNFTEQYILAHLLAEVIQRHAGLKCKLKTGLAGTKICFDALREGEIDLYPEYLGTGLYVLLEGEPKNISQIKMNSRQLMDYIREETRTRFDLEWLSPLGFNNSYALMMREEQAARLNISSISDLSRYLRDMN